MNCNKKEKMNSLKKPVFLALLSLFFAACFDEEPVKPGNDEDPSIHDIDVYTQAESASEYMNSKVKYGEMTDPRDGKVYKTVKLGNSVWMAENLNFSDSSLVSNIADGSWCYNDEPDFCNVGGRLYSWAAAMNIASVYNNGKYTTSAQYLHSVFQQGVCPDGWHLPSLSEFQRIMHGKSASAFKAHKGWRSGGEGNNASGYTVLPTGFYARGNFYNAGFESVFWTSTEYSSNEATVVIHSFDMDDESSKDKQKQYGYSVRCVQDSVENKAEVLDIEVDTLDVSGLMDPSSVEKGSFVDSRDGHKYATVKIGSQTWMAENLAYFASDSESVCYAHSDSLCKVYGMLYTGTFAQKDACPAGWRLPSKVDYEMLLELVGKANNDDKSGYTLKSKDLWVNYEKRQDSWRGNKRWNAGLYNGNGIDYYGFGVLPGGRGSLGAEVDSFFNRGEEAYLWMSIEDSPRYTMRLKNGSVKSEFMWVHSSWLASVRCILGEKPVYHYCSADTAEYAKPSFDGIDSSFAENGYLKDMRDGKYYKIVTIGKQTWMAENLNLDYESAAGSNAAQSNRNPCYKDSTGKCDSFAMYYTWDVAMDSKSVFSSIDDFYCKSIEKHRGICPKGWHLPTAGEWNDLVETVGDSLSASIALKSKTEWKWDGNGLDKYGFCVLPAGRNPGDAFYTKKNNGAFFWTGTDISSGSARGVYFGGEEFSYVEGGAFGKDQRFSVRCVMDSPLLSDAVKIEKMELELVSPCRTGKKDNCSYGSLKDERDDRSYKTVQIGTQTWMAENLEFAHEDAPAAGFYFWSTAVDTKGEYSDNTVGCERLLACNIKDPVRGICPEGWHIPSIRDWKKLFAVVGGKEGAWNALKSSEGWNDNAGVDAYGWNAVPVGYWYGADDSLHMEGSVAHFWSWDYSIWAEHVASGFYADSSSGIEFKELNEDVAASIRCLKDE